MTKFKMNDAIRLEAPRIGPEGYDPLWDDLKSRHYDRKGNVITFREWGMLGELGVEYRVVKQEYVGDYWISTVWLGLDHNMGGGPPMIFETMVFNHSMPKPPPLPEVGPDFDLRSPPPGFQEWLDEYPEQTSASDIECERYSTEEQAIKGHEKMVKKVRLLVEATRKEKT